MLWRTLGFCLYRRSHPTPLATALGPPTRMPSTCVASPDPGQGQQTPVPGCQSWCAVFAPRSTPGKQQAVHSGQLRSPPRLHSSPTLTRQWLEALPSAGCSQSKPVAPNQSTPLPLRACPCSCPHPHFRHITHTRFTPRELTCLPCRNSPRPTTARPSPTTQHTPGFRPIATSVPCTCQGAPAGMPAQRFRLAPTAIPACLQSQWQREAQRQWQWVAQPALHLPALRTPPYTSIHARARAYLPTPPFTRGRVPPSLHLHSCAGAYLPPYTSIHARVRAYLTQAWAQRVSCQRLGDSVGLGACWLSFMPLWRAEHNVWCASAGWWHIVAFPIFLKPKQQCC
jgi:hypothetical protein